VEWFPLHLAVQVAISQTFAFVFMVGDVFFGSLADEPTGSALNLYYSVTMKDASAVGTNKTLFSR